MPEKSTPFFGHINMPKKAVFGQKSTMADAP
jgi:hypothetical protein